MTPEQCRDKYKAIEKRFTDKAKNGEMPSPPSMFLFQMEAYWEIAAQLAELSHLLGQCYTGDGFIAIKTTT